MFPKSDKSQILKKRTKAMEASNFPYPNYFEDDSFKNFTRTLNDTMSLPHLAILERRVSFLESLLKQPSIEVNTQNKNYETPLLAAVRVPDLEISLQLVKVILEAGPDINIPDFDGDSPLHEASKSAQWTPILQILLDHPQSNPNIKNYLGETPLHLAKSERVVQELVKRGADVNSRDNCDNYPLHKHVKNVEICKFLLENGAEINCRNVKGFTPLHEAVANNVRDSFELFLEKGADVNSVTNELEQTTPLQSAYSCRVDDSIKDKLWERSEIRFLLLVAGYDSSKIPEILQKWEECARGEEQILELLFQTIDILENNKEMAYVQCGRLISEFFLKKVEFLSIEGAKKVTRRFSEYLERCNFFAKSLTNFLLRTNDYSVATMTQIEEILTILVKRGDVLSYSDLEIVYLQYGDCRLLHNLLKLPVVERSRKFEELPSFLKILANPSVDITETLKNLKPSYVEVLDFTNIHNLARYCKLPKFLVKYFRDSFEQIVRFSEYSLPGENLEQCVNEIESISAVPSLMELSRNVARPALANSQNISTLFEFQNFLKKLKVPQVIKQILLMNYPFHHGIKTPQYIPYATHAYLL